MKLCSYLLVICCFCMQLSVNAIAQNVIIEPAAVVGKPGDGNVMLTLNSERPWEFRQLGSGASAHLELYSTIGLKHFIVTTTGNMGVGVAMPDEKLHIGGNLKVNGSRITFGTNEYIEDGGSFLINANGTLRSTLDNTDFLGTSARRWNTVYATNGTINTSDATLKSNIQHISFGLKDLMQLRPVSFTWTDNPEQGTKLGLLAQEVKQVIPEVVAEYEWVRTEHGGIRKQPAQHLGLFYADLIPVLIKAIQEQQQLIADQQTENDRLKTDLQSLEQRIQEIELFLKQ